MTKKEILTKLIKKYTLVLRKIKPIEGYEKIIRIVGNHNCEIGICGAAELNFNVFLYSKTWVNREKSDSFYWYACPYEVTSKAEIIDCLQFRIDKMKKILKTCK